MLLLLGYTATASFLFPIIAGSKRKIWRVNKALRILFIYQLLIFTQVMVQYALMKLKIDNHFLSDYFHIFEVFIFSTIFYFASFRRFVKNLFISLPIIFLIFLAVSYIFKIENQIPVDVVSVLARIFLIICSVIMLHDIITSSMGQLTLQPFFWIAFGLLLYSATTLVVVGLGKILMSYDRSIFIAAWNINWVMTIVANSLYTKGMLCK